MSESKRLILEKVEDASMMILKGSKPSENEISNVVHNFFEILSSVELAYLNFQDFKDVKAKVNERLIIGVA